MACPCQHGTTHDIRLWVTDLFVRGIHNMQSCWDWYTKGLEWVGLSIRKRPNNATHILAGPDRIQANPDSTLPVPEWSWPLMTFQRKHHDTDSGPNNAVVIILYISASYIHTLPDVVKIEFIDNGPTLIWTMACHLEMRIHYPNPWWEGLHTYTLYSLLFCRLRYTNIGIPDIRIYVHIYAYYLCIHATESH